MNNNEINDDDLNLGANQNDRLGGNNYSEQVAVKPVRGGAAIKEIFAPDNRKRLFLIVVVGLIVGGALIYVYGSLDKAEALKGGIGSVSSNKVITERNATPTQLQTDEAQRYNTSELPKLQEKEPNAHPLIVVSENPDNKFKGVRDFSRPGKLSDVGSTTEQNISGGTDDHAQSGNSVQQPKDYKAVDAIIQGLIEAEGTSKPALYSMDWNYQKPAAVKVSNKQVVGDLSGEPTLNGNERCANPATRAASMYMATADIALNSDVGGPVALTIHSGRLRGSKLVGKFERKEEWLRMDLTKLVTPDQTVPVQAIGLDMETTLNAVQGDVNNHTLYRYGWWGAGSVLKAIGKAAEMNANSQVIISNGTAIQSTQADASREVKIAVGSLGQDLGDVMRERINRPVTVSIKVNEEVGVFFLEDVCLSNQAKGN